MESRIEIIELQKDCLLMFCYIPKGHICTEFTIQGKKSIKIGFLNNFNRIKSIQKWKTKEHPDMVKIFTEILEKRGWNFDKFPNPIAYFTKVDSIIE